MYLHSISQAYHNELVTKVSRLEEDNLKLKKEKASNTYLYPSSIYYLHPTVSEILNCPFMVVLENFN